MSVFCVFWVFFEKINSKKLFPEEILTRGRSSSGMRMLDFRKYFFQNVTLLTNFFNSVLKFIYIYIYIYIYIQLWIIGLIRYNGIILNDLGNLIVFCCSRKIFC